MTNNNKRTVLIYCRVSDSKQKTDGQGLDSQEHRCRQHALAQGLEVEAVFPDDITGGGDFMKRPGMVALLQHIDKHAYNDYVVMFDDLKRFARDREFHFKLRHALAVRNVKVECLNFKFEDTPEGEFVETVFAAQGQLERLQNRRQTLQKMKARIEQGYAVFPVPIGYCYKKTSEHGKMLFRDEPNASVIQEALEGYASGRFESQGEVKRFLESSPSFPTNKKGETTFQRVNDILTRPIYAGYVEAPKWGVSLRAGKHEGLISLETFQKNQDRLTGCAKAPARKDLNEAFPLRGFVTCGDCDNPLTACFSTSKTKKKHAYYLCYNKSCESHRKSIPRAHIENDFEALLGQLQPTEGLFNIVKAMFKDAWGQKLDQAGVAMNTLHQKALNVEKQIEQLLDRIVDTSSVSVITAYERRIEALEKEKLIMAEKLTQSGKAERPFKEMFELAITFLSNPQKLWHSERLEDKRTVLKLIFADRLAYSRKRGFRTPKTTLPFKVLGGVLGDDNGMVRSGRFELPTP